jgi:hypothetical protein
MLSPMPAYKSHKTVRAAKITAFRQNGNPDMPDLVLGEIGDITSLLPDWHQKHKPQVGGYLVEYEDGYQSFSPAKAFEEGYTKTPGVSGSTDAAIEREIKAKGLTATRVTPADIEANIASESYFTASDGRRGAIQAGTFTGREAPQEDDADLDALSLLTFCVLVLRNGFTVTGESACVSPENFDAEIARKIARANAVNKVWPLMGYALKERLTAKG